MSTIHDVSDAADFMAGVALFEELLRDAERRTMAGERESDAMSLDGQFRSGQPLTLYALPFLERALARPGSLRGFAGALGDYIGCLQQGLVPAPGDQYAHLTFEDCVRIVPLEP